MSVTKEQLAELANGFSALERKAAYYREMIEGLIKNAMSQDGLNRDYTKEEVDDLVDAAIEAVESDFESAEYGEPMAFFVDDAGHNRVYVTKLYVAADPMRALAKLVSNIKEHREHRTLRWRMSEKIKVVRVDDGWAARTRVVTW